MAMAFVSIVSPPFDAQYAARSFTATSPSTEPIFTMAPPPHFRNSASTARDIRNGPFTLTVITRSHSSSLIPSTVETCSVPALFTSKFSRPNRSTVPLTARATLLLDFADHLAKLFQPSARHCHARAFPRKCQRDRSPNPRPAAGNQRHLARKSCHG